jgi:hypothetical protein
MADDDVFSDDNSEPSVEVGLEDLVGEGRKYKTPDELAKAYAHAESHARLSNVKTQMLVLVWIY